MRSKACFLGLVSCAILLAGCAATPKWNAVITCWHGEMPGTKQTKNVELGRNGEIDFTLIGNCDHIEVYVIAPLEESCRADN